MLIDTHCHLSFPHYAENILDVIERAQQAGVGAMINMSCESMGIQKVQDQLALSPALFATLGYHPHNAKILTDDELNHLRTICQNNSRVVGIGEIGLDDYRNEVPMDIQTACFRQLLELALEVKLPVVVHVRETHKLVLAELSVYAQKGGQAVIHCFTGTVEEAQDFLNLGFYISLAGIVTFKNAKSLWEVAKFLPLDRMLVETDSPYLAPMPHRGKTNEPAYVAHVAAWIAELRGVSVEEVARATTENALRLFYKMGLFYKVGG
jgi:TatD DNase family protein